MMKRDNPHSWSEQQVHRNLLKSVEDRWEIFLCNCPSTTFRQFFQSIFCCKSVKQDMCHHFSITDCWWLIFNSFEWPFMEKTTRQLWRAWHFFSCWRTEVISVFFEHHNVYLNGDNDFLFFFLLNDTVNQKCVISSLCCTSSHFFSAKP